MEKMSYDISLCDPVTRQVITTDKRHFMVGGTYSPNGSNKLYLNVTYNYANIYWGVMRGAGIRNISGMSGVESLSILDAAISQLGNDKTENYWEPTEGNAKAALIQLRTMATMRPDGIWKVD